MRWSATLALVAVVALLVVAVATVGQTVIVIRLIAALYNVAFVVLVVALRRAFRASSAAAGTIAAAAGVIGAGAGIVAFLFPDVFVGGLRPISLVGVVATSAWLVGLGLYGAHLPGRVLRVALIGGIGEAIVAAELVITALAPGSPAETILTTIGFISLAQYVLLWALSSRDRWVPRAADPAPTT